MGCSPEQTLTCTEMTIIGERLFDTHNLNSTARVKIPDTVEDIPEPVPDSHPDPATAAVFDRIRAAQQETWEIRRLLTAQDEEVETVKRQVITAALDSCLECPLRTFCAEYFPRKSTTPQE